ncbi:MAG: C45 family autoproteolytic acyltransferase/hydrolase [Thermoguttaceae bacterium]
MMYTKQHEMFSRSVAAIAQVIAVLATPMVFPQDSANDARVAELAATLKKIASVITTEPEEGMCHVLTVSSENIAPEVLAQVADFASGDKKIEFALVRGRRGEFQLRVSSELTGEIALGQNDVPWIFTSQGVVFVGDTPTRDIANAPFLRDDVRQKLLALQAMVQLATATKKLPVQISENDWKMIDALKSAIVTLQLNVPVLDDVFTIPTKSENHAEKQKIVPSVDLLRQFYALANFACDRFVPRFGKSKPAEDDATFKVLAKTDHGLLAERGGYKVMIVEGTPTEMGTAQGKLLRPAVNRIVDRILYGVGTATGVASGEWFIDELAEIERRATPFIPPRYFEEIDALADATGISRRDGHCVIFFPERFHCSGVAVRGKASRDGRVYHARVLDYMSDILLQDEAVLQVFMPTGFNKWVSHGYAGFVGTVTAMNEKGLAMGEMGGRGEGAWDGLPMSLLMRQVMEECDNVEEALALIKKTKLTCEYYYVLSDTSGAMVGLKCTPDEVLVLQPGEQHEMLPPVPEDTILMSAGDRVIELSKRLHDNFGKIDADVMIEIIKRPVAMRSNLHNAIFIPEAREIRVSNAGSGLRVTPACDEPYHTFNLDELIRLYQQP